LPSSAFLPEPTATTSPKVGLSLSVVSSTPPAVLPSAWAHCAQGQAGVKKEGLVKGDEEVGAAWTIKRSAHQELSAAPAVRSTSLSDQLVSTHTSCRRGG
jgi:hypothetical protein